MSGGGLAAPISIMLVDDHREFRDLMVDLLGSQPDLEVVAEAGTLTEARKRAASSKFDVVVLDLGLPDGNGADIIEELCESNPKGAVLIMSASLHPTNIEKAMNAGAAEVLDKLTPPKEVVGIVRRLGNS